MIFLSSGILCLGFVQDDTYPMLDGHDKKFTHLSNVSYALPRRILDRKSMMIELLYVYFHPHFFLAVSDNFAKSQKKKNLVFKMVSETNIWH